MSEVALFVEAVGALADDLPRLIGADWPEFKAQLWTLLDRLEDTTADTAAAAKALIALFRKYPGAYKALVAARAATIVTRGKSRAVVAPARASLTRYVEVEILYATDRARGSSATPAEFYTGDRGSKMLEFGRATVSIPHDHRIAVLESPSLWKLQFRADPEKHVMLLKVEPLAAGELVPHAKTRLGLLPCKEVLVFIHGYNVSFEDATRRVAQVTYDLQFQGLPVLYSWPSEGSGAKYTIDEGNVRWTQPHFKAFLERVLTEFGADTVHVIAHSMGSRVLADTIGSVDPTSLPAGASKLREIVFAAPDFDAQTFAELAETFAGRKERFTLYAASSDLPLGLSKFIHKYGRAGQSPVVVETVDTIDASNVNTSLLGHSYFGDERTLIGDLANLIRNNLPPEKRPGLERVLCETHHYWRFLA
jgi:esterase/lipase superfamily enzyme